MSKASSKTLVSIIIPVYNVEQYIARCLDSVVSQTHKSIEILIIDDGSTDNSGIICDEYTKKDKRIRVIHKKNGGISDARNTGLAHIKGQLVTYIDPDDNVVDNYIETLYEAIRNDDCDIAIAGHITRYPNRDYTHIYKKSTVISGEEACRDLLYDNGIDTSLWAKIFKTDNALKHKFPKNQVFEDTAITGKLLADSARISVIAKPIYYYNRRKKSITTTSFSKEKLDLIKSTQEVTGYITNKYPALKKAAKRRQAFSYLATLSQLAETKKVDKKIKKEIMNNLKPIRRSVLVDKRTPKRDKIAILMTYLGYSFYKTGWRVYRSIRGEA